MFPQRCQSKGTASSLASPGPAFRAVRGLPGPAGRASTSVRPAAQPPDAGRPSGPSGPPRFTDLPSASVDKPAPFTPTSRHVPPAIVLLFCQCTGVHKSTLAGFSKVLQITAFAHVWHYRVRKSQPDCPKAGCIPTRAICSGDA